MVCWGCSGEYIAAVGAAAAAVATAETVAGGIALGVAAVGALGVFIECVQEKCPDWDIQWAIDAKNKIDEEITYLRSLL